MPELSCPPLTAFASFVRPPRLVAGSLFRGSYRVVQAGAEVGPSRTPFVRLSGLQDFRPKGDLEHDRALNKLHLLHPARNSLRLLSLGAAGRGNADIA